MSTVPKCPLNNGHLERKAIMIKVILYLLEKISYRTKFGLSLSDTLKFWYYKKYGQFKIPERCLCGGKVVTHSWCRYEDDISWEIECQRCRQIYGED